MEERIGDQIRSACIAYPVQLYVALSHSSGRETIRLLRDFKDELFMASHNPQLMAEDDRLEGLDETTKGGGKWAEGRCS